MIGIHIKVEGGALIPYLQKGVPVPGESFLTGEKYGKQFQQAVESQGYKYSLCYSLDEFMELVKMYLKDKE